MLRVVRNPRVAFLAAAVVAFVWLNQGPSSRRYAALVTQANENPEGQSVLRAWLPFAFAYRRSADEELYFAIANAVRGAPFDRELLRSKRGDTSPAFRVAPAADGRWHMPYAEVPFEYPALLLPFILLPAALSPSFEVFAPLFGALMAALVLASVHLAICAAPSPCESDRATMWWCATALMLAQGGILVQRLDAVATLCLALALWAAVRRRPMSMGVAVAFAAAAKITPILVIVPFCAADREIWRCRSAWARVLIGLSLGLFVGFAPMIAVSARGFGDFLRYHGARGLQIESTYGTIVAVVKSFCGRAAPATLSFGSYNLDGRFEQWLAKASPVALLAAIAALATWFARQPREASLPSERRGLFARAGLCGISCIWLLGKVFSPQYLTWGIPFAVALHTRRITLSLILAMAIAQVYLRGFYDSVVAMRPLGVASLAARTAALGAVAILSVRARVPRDGAPAPSTSPS